MTRRPDPATTRERQHAPRRTWAGLALLALPLFVLATDVSILYLAAPHLAADLDPSSTQLLWILTIYGFTIAGSLLTMGRLGDRFGHRRLLMIGALAFASASVAAAFAPSAEWLIAARATLGVAGATLMPSTLALIKTMFVDETERRRAIAVWMSVFSLGVATGPAIGGAVLEWAWWGAAFLLGIPPMLLVVLLGPALLPEHRTPTTARLDLISVGLSFAALLPLIWALKQFAARGALGAATVAAVLGATAGWAFLCRQRTAADPLLDLTLFATPRLRRALLLLFAGLLVVNGLFYLYPQLLQSELGLSALHAGLWVVPVATVSVVVTFAVPTLVNKFDVTLVLTAGLALAAGGLALSAVAGSALGLPLLVVAVTVTVIGIAPIPMLSTDLVITAVPATQAGSAAAVTETTGELAVGLSVALVGSLAIAAGGTAEGLVATGVIGCLTLAALARFTARDLVAVRT